MTSIRSSYSQQDTKHNNSILIFNAIRKHGKLSRVAVSHMTGLSKSTVSELVDDMMSEGLIVETGSETTTAPGRKPILLTVNPDGAYFVVIEIINTGYNCYLCNLMCDVDDRIHFRVDREPGRRAAEVVRTLLEKNSVADEKLSGIIIDYPGICDRKNARLIKSVVVDSEPYFCNDDIEELQNAYPDAFVMVDNDSNIAAYSAYRFSDGHFSDVVLYLNMFECVGAGAIFLNDKGENMYNFPLEIGQMVMSDNDGSVRENTLEHMVGALELFRRVNAETDISVEFTEEYLTDTNFGSMKYLGEQLSAGNEKLENVLGDIAHTIALAISNICLIIDPHDIFIGGMIKHLGEPFVEMIRQAMKGMRVIPSVVERNIILSRIDHHMRVMGAANMLADNIFMLR